MSGERTGLSVARVARLLFGVLPQAEVVALIWKWDKRGLIEYVDGDYRWTEKQRKRGGTIRG